MIDPRSALVLFSGGQDSTACLAWALARFARVETIGFDYGQRHRIELDCRAGVREALAALDPAWAARLGDDHLLDLALLGQVSDTALTSRRAIEFEANGLPNTFVPGRNLLFLGFAATIAYRRGASVLVGGMCETDFSGYPDCRDNTHQGDAGRAEPGPGHAADARDAADVPHQGADLGADRLAGRPGAQRRHRREDAHLLPRRTRQPA